MLNLVFLSLMGYDFNVPVIDKTALKKKVFLQEAFTQLNDNDSDLSRYVDKLTYLFILESLNSQDKRYFLSLLIDDEGAKLAINFAMAHIDNFQNRLSTYLKTKLAAFYKGYAE